MVKKLIETTIEIEGLLRVVQAGDAPEEAYTLLKKKTERLAEASDFLLKNHPAPLAKSAEPAETAAQPKEESATLAEPTVESEQTASDEEARGENASTEAYQTLEEESESDDIMLSVGDEDSPEAPAEEAPKYEEKPRTTARTAEKPVATKNLRQYFSLNDRFLYARELFHGDMKMFDNTLRQLDGIEKFQDVEEYFFKELDWDPDQRFVADFMETLRNHFSH